MTEVQSLRICYIIPSLGIGGTERQLVHLIRGLSTRHDIVVICTRHDGALAGDVRRLATLKVLSAFSGWDFRITRSVSKILRAHQPDVVHSFMFGFDYPVNVAAQSARVPAIISSRRQLATWKKPRHVRVQQKANELVSGIVANSQAVATYAQEQEGSPASLYHVIHNGIDPTAFESTADLKLVRVRYKIPFHTEVIGIVANFSPVKDHDLFVRIARELARRRPDVHFLLVGSGDLRAKIERDLARSGLKDRVTLSRTMVELPDLYKLMSVCVLCSKVEGFPNVLMEAMAAGTPVVAPNVGGIPELVQHGETGILVDSREPGDYADAIERILGDEALRASLTANARAHIESRHSIEGMVRAYEEYYVRLLMATRPAPAGA